MNKDNKEEIDRIIKLVSEYTSKLKNLLDLYQEQQKRRLLMIFIFSISIIMIYGIVFFYVQSRYSINYSSYSTYNLVIGFMVIAVFSLFGYFTYSYIKESRNKSDIVDEMRLIKKQLSQLIIIASQTREHIVDRNSFALLEIDLKLTEAEDMISRVNRISTIKKQSMDTNANNI